DPKAVVWRYAGVRPLLDDGASKAQEATRDYVLALEQPALLTVFGGKLTTYRRLAEAAMAKLAPRVPRIPGAWTAAGALPGGDFPSDGLVRLTEDLQRRYPFVAAPTLRRLVGAYGTLTADVLGDARAMADLGDCYGDLSERELAWLVGTEWARTAEDI